jgi:DNA-binding NarL/FixJ family response regulator
MSTDPPPYARTDQSKRLLPGRVRVLIADDHTLVADLCKRLLEPKYEVVGMVNDGLSLVRAAADLRPDVIVVDIAMPVLNGMDASQTIKKMLPSIKLIVLTVNSDADVAAEAFRRGASAYLLKTCAPEELPIAVREVMLGKTYLSATLSRETISFLRNTGKQVRNERDRLTQRQREVLQLLVQGRQMKEVGALLHLSTRTVAFHKYRIMELLDIKTNADLIRYALRHHLIDA